MRYIVLCVFICSCNQENSTQRFKALNSDQTGIAFENTLNDSESFNILEYLYYYNGSGIAIGDLNNDGWSDLYFGSNQGKDQIYFNQGELKFELQEELIREKDLEGWTTGVTIVDINSDGWLDIYVCRLGDYKGIQGSNQLFVNQGGKSFKEEAKKYGLDFSGFSTQACFFDYDRDGDLDCYLLNHSVKNPTQFKPSDIRNDFDSLAGDVFYENVNGKYQDVTKQAGIFNSSIGFGLSVAVSDVNMDGWPDIYVANDFHEQDYLYINTKQKSFVERIQNATGHTSNFSMGSAVADINQDEIPDIITLDMKPWDDAIYKKSGGWESMSIYNYKRGFGYHHQSPRNAMQLSQGIQKGLPFYAELACANKIEATDWSWTPLVADFDNDQDLDLFVANGIIKRPNDLDFVNFDYSDSMLTPFQKLEEIPSGKVANIFFENEGSSFTRNFVGTQDCSTSAAYGDLDNDGDLDVVINRINDPSIIYENQSAPSRFLSVKLISKNQNTQGIGAKLNLFFGTNSILREVKNSEGFMSHSDISVHFGLSSLAPDSLVIHWPDGTVQKIDSPASGPLQIEKEITPSTRKGNNLKTDFIALDTLKGFKYNTDPFTGQSSNKWLLYNSNSTEYQFSTMVKELDSEGDEDLIACLRLEQDESDIELLPHIAAALSDCKLRGLSPANFRLADVDGDLISDFIVAEPWSPILIFLSSNSKAPIELPNSQGMWTSIHVIDIDKDGDLDIIGGNFGVNHSLRANGKQPLRRYTNDFDRNGFVESLISYYDQNKEVPYPNQELFVSQLPIAKKKFIKSTTFAEAKLSELLNADLLAKAEKSEITELRSCYFLNDSLGWEKGILPPQLQVSPLFAVEQVGVFTFFGGNLYDVDPNLGRQDAMRLLAFNFEAGIWKLADFSEDLPMFREEVRDLYYCEKKLYILSRGEYLKALNLESKI